MRNDELNSCAIGAVSSVVDSGHEDGKTRISGAETLLKLTEEGGFGKNKMDVNLNLSATPMSKPGWMMTKDG
jgi:hypothetical protein